MSAAQPLPHAAPVVPMAFGPNEYENTLAALIGKVRETVFSYWGVGLVGLTVAAGACFGLKVAAWTAVLGLIAFGIYAYGEWRFDQVPHSWQLAEAAREGRESKVEALLQCWDSFTFDGAMSSYQTLCFAFSEALRATENSNRCLIAEKILIKIHSQVSEPAIYQLQDALNKAAGIGNPPVIRMFARVYGTIPAEWRLSALREAADKNCGWGVTAMLENGSVTDLPLKEVCLLIMSAKSFNVACPIEQALYPKVSFSFDSNDQHKSSDQAGLCLALQSACREGRRSSVRTVLSKPDTHLSHFGEALIDGARFGKKEVVDLVLKTNRITSAGTLKTALESNPSEEIAQAIRTYAAGKNISLT